MVQIRVSVGSVFGVSVRPFFVSSFPAAVVSAPLCAAEGSRHRAGAGQFGGEAFAAAHVARGRRRRRGGGRGRGRRRRRRRLVFFPAGVCVCVWVCVCVRACDNAVVGGWLECGAMNYVSFSCAVAACWVLFGMKRNYASCIPKARSISWSICRTGTHMHIFSLLRWYM